MRFQNFFSTENPRHLGAYLELLRTGCFPETFNEQMQAAGVEDSWVMSYLADVVAPKLALRYLQFLQDQDLLHEEVLARHDVLSAGPTAPPAEPTPPSFYYVKIISDMDSFTQLRVMRIVRDVMGLSLTEARSAVTGKFYERMSVIQLSQFLKRAQKEVPSVQWEKFLSYLPEPEMPSHPSHPSRQWCDCPGPAMA
jgi:hypothetical protein